MSEYEDYTSTSRSYDQTRSATGVEVILGCIGACVPLGDAVVLDAGCGSGNYAAAVAPRVGHLIGVDLNEAMLGRARDKLEGAVREGRAEFHQGDLRELPVADAAVDAVMINQVLHHLPEEDGGDWPHRRQVLAEVARVLRPGGVLVINTCLRRQLEAGYWFMALIPEVREKLAARHPDAAVYRGLLADCGLSYQGRIVPLDAVLQGDSYHDPLGPLSASWREGDSAWALASPAELERALATLEELRAQDRAGQFHAQHDAGRHEVGQITFLHARRD